MRLLSILLGLIILGPPAAFADDYDAIAFTVFDYIDGWYGGDAGKMERALHPDLAKRSVSTDAQGAEFVDHMSALRLVQLTRSGTGTATPPAERVKEVIILDLHDDVASVKTIMHGWIDYMHLARVNGRWLIVNVLWDRNEPG